MREEDDEGRIESTPAARAREEEQPQPTDLQAVLDELRNLKKMQDEAQVDAKIAELQKLVAEAAAAETEFAKEHPALADEEERLKNEVAAMKSALEAALKPAGIAEVKKIVGAKVNAASDALDALAQAQEAVAAATAEAEAAGLALKAAETELAAWRRPVKGVVARQKAVDTALKDIQRLQNSSRRGEAYWKLVLADAGETPGLDSVQIVLDGPLKLIPPEALRKKLEDLWKAFSDAKTVAAEKALVLAARKSELAAATKAYDNISKTLIKAITDALAEREAAAHAA